MRPGRRRRTAGGRSAAGVPWPLAVPAAVGGAFVLVPMVALVVRAPLRRMPRLLTSGDTVTALRLSLECATITMVVSVVLGAPLAYVVSRAGRRVSGALRVVITLPLVFPPVVGGIALLMALGRTGLVGRYLDSWFGITLPFTTAGVVVAQTFVAMPFLVISVEGALRSADRRLEEAAATLGARPFTTFRRVTLPLIAPSLLAGSALCWARALGEFGATITFAGSFPGTTQTMPIAVYDAFQTDVDSAVALSLVLVAVSVVVLALLRDHWWRPGSAVSS